MTKHDIILYLEELRDGQNDIETVMSAVEEYSSASNKGNTLVMRMMAVSFAKWLRDKTVADGSPKLLLRSDIKRYTIEELYDLYTLITE